MKVVYLDQSIYSNMANAGAAWEAGPEASLLRQALASRTAEVWVSPTHIMELAQTNEPIRRIEIASIMLSLTEARRMLWGHEFAALSDFFEFVDRALPGAVINQGIFERHSRNLRQLSIGALGLMATKFFDQTNPIIRGLALQKAQNQFRHAKFLSDPASWVRQMVETVEQRLVDPQESSERLTLEDLRTRTAEAAEQAIRLSPEARRELNTNRTAIARAYGAMELGAIIPAVFSFSDVLLSFDFGAIVKQWGAFRTQRLPSEASVDAVRHDARLAAMVVQRLIYAAVEQGLPTTTAAYLVLLRELERCIGEQSVPTGGLAFDLGHAGSLLDVDIFMTADRGLAASIKSTQATISREFPKERCAKVVENPLQLERALRA